jgi:hypothetical protein
LVAAKIGQLPPDLLTRASEALSELIAEAGGARRLVTPRGYPHMGLVILDSMFSLQADYDIVVVPLLRRYCEKAPGLSWPLCADPGTPEHTARDLLGLLESLDVGQRLDLLNRQIAPGTSRGTGGRVTKAEAVMRIARVLVKDGISSRRDFRDAVESGTDVGKNVLEIRGVGFACWQYMLSLSGVEKSKPDTMIVRWSARELGQQLSPKTIAGLIEQATDSLQTVHPGVTVRQVDHLIWRKESGRTLTDSADAI